MPEEISLKIPAGLPFFPRGQAGTAGNGNFFLNYDELFSSIFSRTSSICITISNAGPVRQ